MVQRGFYADGTSDDGRRGKLTVDGHGGVEVHDVVRFLKAIEDAYNGVLQYLDTIEDLTHYSKVRDGYPPIFGSRAAWPLDPSRRRNPDLYPIPYEDRLVLSGVKLSSPGPWDFIGALNPLEVLRKYLQDRHERRKDVEYRERAEQRRLDLDNIRAEVKVLAEITDMARHAGVPEREISRLFTTMIADPLERLGQHQNSGMVGAARLQRISDGRTQTPPL